jgi:hypothetical protein
MGAAGDPNHREPVCTPRAGASQTANREGVHGCGGLEAAWNQLGIGEQPGPTR